jgi:hypothetical protein
MLKFMLKVEYTLELLELTGSRPLSGATWRIVGRPCAPLALYAPAAAAGASAGDDRSLTAAFTALLSGTARSRCCSARLSSAVFDAAVGSSATCSSGADPGSPRTQFPHLSAM